MAYVSTNPATGEVLKSYDEFDSQRLEVALEAARNGFLGWRFTTLAQRASLLKAVAGILGERADEFAKMMAIEVGKPLREGVAEIKKSADGCRFYAEQAEAWLVPQVVMTDAGESYITFEPLGPIFAIMPWNYPFWQLFRHAAPALMAGNVILLKHTPHTPEIALAIEKIFRDAGLPAGCFQTLFLTNDDAARAISDSRVAAVTLTGSTAAGRKVAEIAGRSLKKTVLELGGSDPFVVFEDADVEEAVRVGAFSRSMNAGQSCISAKRFIVHRSVYEAFGSLFVEAMKAHRLGDPLDAATTMGPMARRDLRDHLADQVERSVALGARVLTGAEIPQSDGFYYTPTVLTDVPESAPARCEELFGPVATIYPFDTDDEAIELANDTEYGLGASIWTADMERAKKLIPRMQAGSLFINGMVKSDPRMPFGGIKNSGYGRELSREGMLEFTNIKTVWIK